MFLMCSLKAAHFFAVGFQACLFTSGDHENQDTGVLHFKMRKINFLPQKTEQIGQKITIYSLLIKVKWIIHK